MLASLTASTLKQYNTTYKLWWSYCLDKNINYLEAPTTVVIVFLTEQYKKGASYSSLNSHRSALSLLLGNKVGSDEQVSRLLKGAYKQRPSLPKYQFIWDPQTVLNFISGWYPNEVLPLDQITKKLAMLLALCTGHRVQTISVIKLTDFVFSPHQITITIIYQIL